MNDLTVARTILEQLGGRRFLAMTGAKGLAGNARSLSMRVNGKNEIGKVNLVRITLDPSDTYTVESFFVREGKHTLRYTQNDVYFDMLGDVFYKATGLYTKL